MLLRIDITTGSGTIQSTNFPNLYEANERCRWTFIGESITLVFESFDVEPAGCQYDFIKLRSHENVDLVRNLESAIPTETQVGYRF